jgi:hypothetical protein
MKRESFTSSLLSSPATILSIVGIVAFSVLRIAYTAYYRKYGVSPDAVGLGYIPLLVKQISPANLILLGAVACLVLWRSRLISKAESLVDELQRSLSDADERLRIAVAAIGGHAVVDIESAKRRVAELEANRERLNKALADSQTNEQQIMNKGRRWLGFAALILLLWIGVLLLQALTAEPGERHPSPFDFFQADVIQVEVISDNQSINTRLGKQGGNIAVPWLLLGDNGGRLVLYNEDSQLSAIVPSNSVTLLST